MATPYNSIPPVPFEVIVRARELGLTDEQIYPQSQPEPHSGFGVAMAFLIGLIL